MSRGTISSRTPEGRSGRCPICRAFVCMEPSFPAGDAPCPGCGHLIFFLDVAGTVRNASSRLVRKAVPYRVGRVVARVAGRLRRAVRELLPARKMGPGPEAASSPRSGVWDSWLDG